MDFYQIQTKETKDKTGVDIYPDFLVERSQDLMVQGRAFYAIWDEVAGLWSKDEYDVQRLVDEHLEAEAAHAQAKTGLRCAIKSMRSFQSNSWSHFKKFLQNVSDNHHPL